MTSLATRKLQRAWDRLLDLLAEGVEYPDAEWRASDRGRLCDCSTLRALYDEHCSTQAQPAIVTSTDYRGVACVLVCQGTGRVVHTGDRRGCGRGFLTVTGGRAPHKAGSTGRVETDQGSYFPSVVDAEWVPTHEVSVRAQQ